MNVNKYDAGVMFSPYIPLQRIHIVFSGPFKYDEKKDYHEFYERNKENPIIYRLRKGYKYDSKILKIHGECVDLSFKNKFGKIVIKKGIPYYERGYNTSCCWYFK